MGLGPALPIIVGAGVGTTLPFTAERLLKVGTSNPPTVTDSILREVSVFSHTGIEIVDGGYFVDGGAFEGISLVSQTGGGGVYLLDESETGIYLIDESPTGNSPGIYVISGDNGASFSGGVFIIQEADDSVGIWLDDFSTSGNSKIHLQTVNGDIEIIAGGAGKKIILDGTVEFAGGATPFSIAAPSAAGVSLEVAGFGGAGQAAMAFSNITDGAGAALGTLANSPVAGPATVWVPIRINGVTRHFPAW